MSYVSDKVMLVWNVRQKHGEGAKFYANMYFVALCSDHLCKEFKFCTEVDHMVICIINNNILLYYQVLKLQQIILMVNIFLIVREELIELGICRHQVLKNGGKGLLS
jgi:hypothetical protein